MVARERRMNRKRFFISGGFNDQILRSRTSGSAECWKASLYTANTLLKKQGGFKIPALLIK